MTDLFMNKQEQLKCWMRDKNVFATHDVIRWGSENFYNRADRTKRDFTRKGIIRHLSELEKHAFGYKCKDDVYAWNGGGTG